MQAPVLPPPQTPGRPPCPHTRPHHRAARAGPDAMLHVAVLLRHRDPGLQAGQRCHPQLVPLKCVSACACRKAVAGVGSCGGVGSACVVHVQSSREQLQQAGSSRSVPAGGISAPFVPQSEQATADSCRSAHTVEALSLIQERGRGLHQPNSPLSAEAMNLLSFLKRKTEHLQRNSAAAVAAYLSNCGINGLVPAAGCCRSSCLLSLGHMAAPQPLHLHGPDGPDGGMGPTVRTLAHLP